MQRVVITGGLGVLGQAVAQAFSQAGHAVVLVARAPAPADAAYPVVGGADLSDAQAAADALRRARETLGGVDVLVNVAGAFRFEMIADGDPAAWDLMFKANLKTCANMCRAAAAELSPGGAIINIGAAAADRAGPGMGPYAASKAGVARLTESLAAELKGRLRVNAVLPQVLDTPRNRLDMPDVDPAGWTAPAAVADVILFLASDQGRAINGALVPVTATTAR